jgi:hypothetical protein
MNFESGEYRVISPLDPSKGERFVEVTCLDLEEINQLYRTIVREEECVNPTVDGYSAGEALHRVFMTQTRVWRIGNHDYMKFPQGGVQE